MIPGLDFEALLDALAEKVAARLQGRLRVEAKPAPRLMDVEHAAAYLGRSTHSVRHLIATKKLPVVKLDERVFLDVRDLDQAIEKAKTVLTNEDAHG